MFWYKNLLNNPHKTALEKVYKELEFFLKNRIRRKMWISALNFEANIIETP